MSDPGTCVTVNQPAMAGPHRRKGGEDLSQIAPGGPAPFQRVLPTEHREHDGATGENGHAKAAILALRVPLLIAGNAHKSFDSAPSGTAPLLPSRCRGG